ncbi:MAG: DNA translocase FtsK 4TM domain-containing protein [Chloroflexi bacterium]|nr:DNA translocase FtsK 4TM domain-containing protein [Chloroflexota bacterium]
MAKKDAKKAPPKGKGKPAKGKAPARGGAPRPAPQFPPDEPLPGMSLDTKLDILGIVFVAIAVLTLLGYAWPNQGDIMRAWLNLWLGAFGWSTIPALLGLAAAGLWLLARRFGDRLPKIEPERVAGVILMFVVLTVTFHAVLAPASTTETWRIAQARSGGGYLGGALLELALEGLGWPGTIVALVTLWIIAIVLTVGRSIPELVRLIAQGIRRVRRLPEPAPVAPSSPTAPAIYAPPSTSPAVAVSPTARAGKTAQQPKAPPPGDPAAHPPGPKLKPQTPAPPAPLREPPPPAASPRPAYDQPIVIGGDQPWLLPKVEDVLEQGAEGTADDEFDRARVKVIESTLASFGAPAHVVEVNRGPVITQFGVEPDFLEARGGKRMKVKVGKIAALADDLALALAAASIRIEAPVPGKGYVGIEVPNNETAIVALREVMESEGFKKLKGTLRIGLGQDVSGQAISADLTAMPHLLIAGTTGSGKSVCVNAIIAALLLQNTPDDLKVLMVDPKRVELTTYNGIPHLLAPVVTELERVVASLQWVTREMDERYRKFAKAGARNIADYNARAALGAEKKLPYLVVIIDELADLMMLAPDETERTITRLAQMSRATGIHLIIATQRPSVDVVTGLIKANFPARVSFAVASSVDSRVVLDQPGAEKLLGRGDMLFQSPDSAMPLRMQGVWVSDIELQKLVRYWKGARGLEEGVRPEGAPAEAPVTAKQAPLWAELRAEIDKPAGDGEDELLNDAIQVVREMRKASISLLQRRLRIGYTRAARLIDLLEEKGIVGPAQSGAQPREVIGYSDDVVTPEGAPKAPPGPSADRERRRWEMAEEDD